MRKLLLTATALATFGIAAPAFADDAAPLNQTTQPAMQAPADTTTAQALAAASKFIGEQVQGQMLASSIIGAPVYGPGDENLGDVNDIVLAADGSPYAVVIGVGGFLGLGEKNVAVPFSTIQTSTDADGKIKLALNVSKEELDAAPAFTSLAMLKQQQQLDPIQPMSPDVVPAPASPATPIQPAPNPAG